MARFTEAKEIYKKMGVDAESALSILKNIPVSVHCWQGDDVIGFDNAESLSGGIQTTGNYPGRARNVKELMADIDKMLSLVPGKKKLNLHACYAITDGAKVDRDSLRPEHFKPWLDFAKKRGLGIDFNPTFFSHEMVKDNLTLSSPDENVRKFWVEHGKRCIEISEYFARETKEPCVMNIWIPDGYKDIPADRLGPRMRFKKSLDEILSVDYDKSKVYVCLESKVFGIGMESFTVGSNEFCMNYVTQRGITPLMDNGHYHPTEVVSDKISAMLAFHEKIALHITRGVRWDSDHVVLFDDETREIAKEIVRNDALDRVFIATDYFDASINRLAAWVTGLRSVQKAFLYALLEPSAKMKKMQDEGDFTSLMAVSEELKTAPFGDIWEEYLKRENVESDYLSAVKEYEEKVLLKRHDETDMKKFVRMCKKIGQMTDYVQGGGGNASCKHDGNKMAIKASGFTIKDITEESGYVDVDFLKIREFHTDVPAEEMEKREKESTPFTLSCVIPAKDGAALRPSVETGFHSLMKKYVMHTHPIYANVLTCACGGRELAEKILAEEDFVWIPYINPGFSLSLAIGDAISDYEKEKGVFPKVIFLENHGLITTSDDADECAELHIRVNDAIKSCLKLKDFYSDLSLEQEGELQICKSEVIADYFAKYGIEEIEKNALYPDQLVYLNSGLKDGKIIFEKDRAIFKTSKAEALAMLETFAAFAYIIDCLQAAGLDVHVMDSKATGFINNWEGEKYRKSVVK